MTLDLHKTGLVGYPCGAVFTARGATEVVRRPVGYLSSGEDRTLSGSRPGSMAFASWAVLNALGQEGYRAHAARVVKIAGELRVFLARKPWLEVVSPTWSNYATVRVRPERMGSIAGGSGSAGEDHPAINWTWAQEFSISRTVLDRAAVPGNPAWGRAWGYKIVIMPHVRRSVVRRFMRGLDRAEGTS